MISYICHFISYYDTIYIRDMACDITLDFTDIMSYYIWFCLPCFRCLHEQWPHSRVQTLRVEGPRYSAFSQSFSIHEPGWGMAVAKAQRLRLYHRNGRGWGCTIEAWIMSLRMKASFARVGCSIRCADKKVCFIQFFHCFTSMDGLALAATALTSTKDCPTCECPRLLGSVWERPTGSILFGNLMSYVGLLRRLARSSSIRTRASRTAA